MNENPLATSAGTTFRICPEEEEEEEEEGEGGDAKVLDVDDANLDDFLLPSFPFFGSCTELFDCGSLGNVQLLL